MPDLGIVTARDPRDSMWQSIVEKVAKAESKAALKRGVAKNAFAAAASTAGLSDHLAELVAAAHAQVYERHEGVKFRGPLRFSLAPVPAMTAAAGGPVMLQVGRLETGKRCSSLAIQLAEAKAFGTSEQIAGLQSAFDFNVCDPFWEQCINEYVAYFKVAGKQIPYRPGRYSVLGTAVPATATIALFGDWGTGTQAAREVLEQIQGFGPDILMHLGDVYYSGTQEEMQERFLDVCRDVFGSSMPARFSLSGNHDMYSGGQGYYWLVDQIGQGASYFAIENNDWLFVAMDTGVHDYKPLQFGGGSTFLMPNEAEWVNNLVANKGNKKAVLLSHHPLFSAFDPISGGPVNQVLLSQLQPSIPNVTAWFWGHEHRLGIYDLYQGLARGRCLGHAAVPVFADATGDAPKFPDVPLRRENGDVVDMGQEDGLFKHGFAIMKLNGPNATVSYYRQGESSPLWQETF
jgi:hypothetical protein